MMWPVHPLDMCPMKHLWNMMEKTICTQDSAPTNIKEL